MCSCQTICYYPMGPVFVIQTRTALISSYRVTDHTLSFEHELIWINHALQWRYIGRDGVSNHQPRDCLLNRISRRRSQKTSQLRGTGLCAGNSTVTGEFPAQMASNAENVSIWWRHHGINRVITATRSLLIVNIFNHIHLDDRKAIIFVQCIA